MTQVTLAFTTIFSTARVWAYGSLRPQMYCCREVENTLRGEIGRQSHLISTVLSTFMRRVQCWVRDKPTPGLFCEREVMQNAMGESKMVQKSGVGRGTEGRVENKKED